MEILLEFWKSNPKITEVSKKIQAVMIDVEKLIKDSKNDFQHYAYVSESNAVAKIRQSWVNHGLIAIPFTDNVIRETVAGKQTNMTTVSMIYQIIDTDSGEYLLARFCGQGVDSGDKGIYKAITGANKYFLFKTFQLETSDSPHSTIDPEYTSKTQPRQQQQNTDKPYLFKFKAKYQGTCPDCKIMYQKGESMVKTNENQVIHEYCFEKR